MVLGFFKREKVNIGIELDRPSGPYYPGDTVQGSITLRGEKDMKVREVRAGLVFSEWYKFREEDSDGMVKAYQTTAEHVVAQETLLGEAVVPSDFDQTYQVSWQIPDDAVPAYSGEITRNRWLVRVTCDRKLKGDVNEEAEVVLLVPAPGQQLQPGEFGETDQLFEADVRIWLPRREWVEQETVQGRLIVRPGTDFAAGDVRVALMRLEEVPRDEGNRHEVAVDEMALGTGTRFRRGQPVEYPFSLTIGSQGCPTRRTGHSVASWIVRATVSRRLRKDYTVGAEIFVYNAPAPS